MCIDVRQPDTIAAAVDETLKVFGHLDILINSMWLFSKMHFFNLWLAEFVLKPILKSAVL